MLVCTGSQHGLTVVLATLLEPGDVLLTESLTYAGLQPVAGLLRLRLRGLAIDAYGLRPDALAEACREGGVKALYLIPTLHNPTTAVMPEPRRREIADDRARARPRDRRGRRARPAAERAARADRGARARAHLLPHQHLEDARARPAHRVRDGAARDVPRLAASLRATTWAVAPLTAAVASQWIRNGTADAILAARREEARARQALAREKLRGFDFDSKPEAYYLWLRLPEPWRSESFAAEARARNVLVTPADAFDDRPGPAAARGAAVHRRRTLARDARPRARRRGRAAAGRRSVGAGGRLAPLGPRLRVAASSSSSSASSASAPAIGFTKAARTGGGIGEPAPRTDFQMISFSSQLRREVGLVQVHAQRGLRRPARPRRFISSSGTRAGRSA